MTDETISDWMMYCYFVPFSLPLGVSILIGENKLLVQFPVLQIEEMLVDSFEDLFSFCIFLVDYVFSYLIVAYCHLKSSKDIEWLKQHLVFGGFWSSYT